MSALSGLLIATLNANPDYLAACPNTFYNEMPEFLPDPITNELVPVRVPFAVLELPEENPEWNFENSFYDITEATITYYALSPDAADSIGALAQAVLDNRNIIDNTGVRVTQALRTTSKTASDEYRDRDGNLVSYHEDHYTFMYIEDR